MILAFPDLETIRLALTSGAVPPAVAVAPAVAGVEADGRVWIEAPAELPKKALIDLRRLGALVVKARGAASPLALSCWLQLFPLERSADALANPGQTPVLFELTEPAALAPLVSEILRLGNDRQSYRCLADAKGSGHVLLRVIGPPYYSLLRAVDRDGRTGPLAYVEQAPGLWVQIGYRHPLAEHLKPAAGTMLLLRPPRRWTALPEAPFRDIYEVLEFSLPAPNLAWREGDLERRLTVPLRLSPGGASDPAEMWVLRERPLEQLDALVHEADDTLLSRLSFAVGDRDGAKTVVLRVRPSKQAPPVLALGAVEFCHFQRMPNLFLPVGTRLHPPLRRDAVRRHLAEDASQVTWLYPGPDGTFTLESLPETAFRPLADWIDYVLDQDHQALASWMESARFDFEPFVCEEDRPPSQPRPSRRSAPNRSASPPRREVPSAVDPEDEPADGDTPAPPPAQMVPEVPEVPSVPASNAARDQLRTLEERFLATPGGLDSAARVPLWSAMASLNARLGFADDAGVCWMNALWLADDAVPAKALAWLRAEASAVPLRSETGWPTGRTWISPAILAARGAALPGEDLDRLLKLTDPRAADVRTLAAYVLWASGQKTPDPALAMRLGPVGQYLHTHEAWLPVRAAWLAALALHRLAGGDALGLARARDRLLARLFQSGLRAEQDLPSFLRFSGPAGGQRGRAVRQWLVALADRARHWAERNAPPATEARTTAYIDLFFAFGLAKLGELEASNRLLQQATAALDGGGQAHEFLLNAYAHRIRQAQQGETRPGALPDEYMETLLEIYQQRTESGDTQGVGDWYIIDRLREQSRILEPDQKIRPYRHMGKVQEGPEQTLQKLPDILDREEAAGLVRQLLRKAPQGDKGAVPRASILTGALNQAPRIGEDFAREMLPQVPEVLDLLPVPRQADEFERQATLLEKALFVAAHFELKESVPGLIARFERLLQSQRDAPTVHALDAAAAQSFRGLRKLGMQEESRSLLQQMADAMLRGRGLETVQDAQWQGRQPAALRALLHVAGGWYYFGQEPQATLVVQAARTALLTGPAAIGAMAGQDLRERVFLARAYAASLGQAPVELAQERFEELFDHLDGIRDPWTTSRHYQLSQLLIVEAVVLAVVSEDFTLGPAVRRWLDEDEYLVRKRMHRDVRELVSAP